MRLASLLPVFLAVPAMLAQSPIEFLSAKKVWVLHTDSSAYALGVNPRGELQNLYWAGPLWRAEDIPAASGGRDLSSFDPAQSLINEEFVGWGGTRYLDPSVKITRAGGGRDLVLHYVSHSIAGNDLKIVMKDIKDDIFVTLNYHVYEHEGIIRKSAMLENRSKTSLNVESLQAGVWYMPHGEGYRLSYVSGRWAAESQLTREDIHTGTKVLESRKGHTSHNFNPWFAIDDGSATEEKGRVWFGALGWSGNWRIAVEQTPYSQVRVTGGFNTFDFGYALKPGESLESPPFYGGYSEDGFGGMSRRMHRFELTDILPHGLQARLRPVLYNSWEATTFAVNEAGQRSLAEKAAKLGVELFVMDDGWFGKRNNDHAGLGDWTVNPQKFPNGLEPLIKYVNSLGMDFGLWVEPEMVNPDSDLYRAHPDWAMHSDDRPRSELRNQLVLNLARNDVKEYIFGVLDKLATQYPIRYFKWDMNRPFAEPGWENVPEPKELWVQYVRNLYEIIDRLRAKHPNLEIESCSGGGGRIDLGILRRVEEVWTSDNTEAFDRLGIQYGFSQIYAPKIMSAWVTDVPNMNGRSAPLQYRFLVAMQGALGVGANLNKWTDQDDKLATEMIAFYKRIRGTVQEGNLYRLLSPQQGEVTANEYVSQDGKQAVLFAFLHSQQYRQMPPAIRLTGLDPRATYRIQVWGQPNAQEFSGAYLMENGVNVRLTGDYDSAAVEFQRQ
ncbi:MAG TPA: alpha-galactosidase [Bryobacteraceae bacterium]|nr:alpha-galactosidase [Bryobacteraceae bacterium]